MPGRRASSKSGYNTVNELSNETKTILNTNYVYYGVNAAIGAGVFILAAIQFSDTNGDNQSNWPYVKTNFRTPPKAGHGNGEIIDNSFNVFAILLTAGLIQFLYSLGKVIRWGPFIKSEVDNSEHERDVVTDTVISHGIVDGLLLLVILSQLKILNPYVLMFTVICHFLAFYIVAIMQGIGGGGGFDIDTGTTVESIFKSVMAHAPVIVAFIAEAYTLITWAGYASAHSASEGVGETQLSGVMVAVPWLFFALTMIGFVSFKAKLFEKWGFWQLISVRLTGTVFRSLIAFTLLLAKGARVAPNLLLQADFP